MVFKVRKFRNKDGFFYEITFRDFSFGDFEQIRLDPKEFKKWVKQKFSWRLRRMIKLDCKNEELLIFYIKL